MSGGESRATEQREVRLPDVGARGPDARQALRMRSIRELEVLHAEVGELAKVTRAWSGRRARRRLRQARQAEADLLRVLDFNSWEGFVAYLGTQLPDRAGEPRTAEPADTVVRPAVGAPEPVASRDPAGGPPVDDSRLVTPLTELARDVERLRGELADSLGDFTTLREVAREISDEIQRASEELVLLRLEVLVATRRMRTAGA